MNECKTKKALTKHLLRVVQIIMCLLFTTSLFVTITANDNLLIDEVMQQKTVRGNVVDNQGDPLIGVTISVKGTSSGTTTDHDGNYALSNISNNDILVFSYVGFTTVEEVVRDRSSINVVMEEEATLIDELVVIGYGTVRKRDLTGSVSSVRTADIPMTSVASVAHSLQGKAAGLIVVQNSAQPGGGLDIIIRGQSSINAGNDPLYVVDGFPILQMDQPGATVSDSRLSVGTQGPLNFLNPTDIESIEVLKDASATAIYGSRAANGVVLITTKRGRTSKPEVDFSGTFGVQQYLDTYDNFSDLGEWMAEVNNIAYESWLGGRGVYPYGGDPFGNERLTVAEAHAQTQGTTDQWENEYDENGNILRGSQPFSNAQIAENMGKKGSDWLSKLTQIGTVQQYNVSLRGGTPITRYMASLSYFDHEGIVKNSRLRRYTGRFNFDQEFGSRIKAQMNILASNTNNDNITHGDTQYENSSLIRSAIEFNPMVKYRNPDGTYPVNQIVGNRPNPLSLLHVTDNTKTNRLLANASVTVEPINNLFIKFSTGMDISYSTRGNYFPKETLYGAAKGGEGRLWNRFSQHTSNELTATYNLDIGSVHNITLLGGYIFEKTTLNSSNLLNHDFITDGFLWNNLSAGTGTKELGSNASENMMASFLGRVNYVLLDRYLLTATIRRDGSSVFAANNKWGLFPSFAVGWNLAEESFMDFSNDFLDMAKLRVSWGQTGNANIGGRHNATYSTIYGWTKPSSGNYTGVIPGRISNPDLKWETTTEFNFGFDVQLSVLNGITIAFERYKRKIEDLLQTRRTAAYQYLRTVWANVGATQNNGYELTVNTRNIMRKDFTWGTDFTFTKYEDRWLRRDSEWIPNIWETNEQDLLRPIYSTHALGILQKGDPIPLHHLTPQYGGTGLSTLMPGGLIIADINGRKLDENGNPMVDERGKVILSGEPDGIIDDADRVFIGSTDPSFIIGLGNKLTYKAFDFNIHMYGMFDRIMQDPTFMAWGQSGGNMVSQHLNALRVIKDRWMDEEIFPDRKESTTHARSGSADWYYQDAWFIRAQSISLGYTLPKTASLANVLESARVFLDVQNAFVITPYTGNDPETDRFSAAYPNARTYTLGVNLKF